MGYRLEISEIIYKESGGKLFGYVDKEKLKSHKWLLEKGFIDGDEYWDYGYNPQIVLNSEEFKEFFKLYDEYWDYGYNPQIVLNSEEFKEFFKLYKEDLKEYYQYDLEELFFKDLLENKNDKLLEWW